MPVFTKGITCEERKKYETSYNRNVLVCERKLEKEAYASWRGALYPRATTSESQ